MVAPTLDSNPNNGTQGEPISANLNTKDVQPNSPPAPASSPEQIGTLVAKAVQEALQDPNILKGIKDRRFNQIDRKLEEYLPVMDKVKELLTPEQREQFDRIQRDAEIADLKRAVYGEPQTQTNIPANGNQGNVAFDVESVVKAMQFDGNDVAVAAVKKAYANDPAQMISQLAQLKIHQSNFNPNSPANALPPQGGSPAQANSQGELQNEYEKKRNQIVQTMRGDEATRALANLRVEMRGKGLNSV